MVFGHLFFRGKLGLFIGGRSKAIPRKRVAHDLVDVEEGKRMRYHGLFAMDAVSFIGWIACWSFIAVLIVELCLHETDC